MNILPSPVVLETMKAACYIFYQEETGKGVKASDVRSRQKNASSETRNEIESLIAGESVMKVVNEELTYKELYDNIENVWSVLFTTGYLTQRGEAEGKTRRLVIPNREIHNIFMSQIRIRRI